MLLFPLVSAQTTSFTRQIKSNLTATCRAEVVKTFTKVLQTCGGTGVELWSTNPVAAIGTVVSPIVLSTFCSSTCKKASSEISLVGPCGNQILFNESYVPAADLHKAYETEASIFCLRNDENTINCADPVYKDLLKTGFDPKNSATLATSFNKFSTSKEYACTPCALKFARALAQKAQEFTNYDQIILAGVKQVDKTCGTKSNALKWSLAALAAVLVQ